MIGIAYAQQAAAPPAGGGDIFAMLPMLAMIFAVFYFLILRPQQKQAKERQQFLKNLKRGDKVLTGGGIHGKITGLTETAVTLEIADNVRVKAHRGSIMSAATASENQVADTAKKG